MNVNTGCRATDLATSLVYRKFYIKRMNEFHSFTQLGRAGFHKNIHTYLLDEFFGFFF